MVEASGIGSKAAPTLGVLAAWFEDTYVALVVGGVAEVVRSAEANLICYVGGWPGSRLPENRGANVTYDLVSPDRVDGLILVSGTLMNFMDHAALQRFSARFQPLPMVSIAVPVAGVPSVTVESDSALRKVLNHLVEVHRRRRIAFVCGPETSAEAAARFRVYREVLSDHGIAFDPDLVAPGAFDPRDGEMAVGLFLDERKIAIDSLVAANDPMAFGAMKTLRSRGIRIPEDVAVVGFDDTDAAAFTTPALTTIRQPLRDLGRVAAKLLMRRLRGEAIEERVVLRAEPVFRESCGCNPQTAPCDFKTTSDRQQPSLPIALRLERSHVAATITRGMSPARASSACAENLVDALAAELINPSGYFLHALDQILGETLSTGGSVWEWHSALASLRSWIIPKLAHDRKAQLEVEKLFFQAHDVVGDKTQRDEGRHRLLAEHRARSLNDLGRRLLEADDLVEVTNALDTSMKELGVPSYFVAMYEDPEAPLSGAELVIEREEGAAVSYPTQRIRVESRKLLPDDILARATPFALVLEPLYLRDEQIGYCLFDSRFESAIFYDDLRQQLSSALKRIEREAVLAELHREAQLRSQRLEQTYKTVRENQRRLVLSENTAALGRLTAGMAHEMNTPLAAVRMALEELTQLAAECRTSLTDPDVTPDDHRQIVREIREATQLAAGAADRVAGFISGVHFQTRDVQSERYLFNAVPVIQDTLLLLAHALRKAQCSIRFEPTAPELRVWGSPGRLAQVITNLVTNAIDASRKRGGGTITIRLAASPGRVTLTVIDQGSGIAPENLQRIFDPMFTTKPFGEGTGLGLSIVHNIVTNDFNGTIDVNSELDRGTTFTLTLNEPQGAKA